MLLGGGRNGLKIDAQAEGQELNLNSERRRRAAAAVAALGSDPSEWQLFLPITRQCLDL